MRNQGLDLFKDDQHFLRNGVAPWFIGAVILMGGFALDISLELGVAGGVPYILVILIGLGVSHRHYILFAGLTGALLIIVSYFLSPAGGEELKKYGAFHVRIYTRNPHFGWSQSILKIVRKLMKLPFIKIVSQRLKESIR